MWTLRNDTEFPAEAVWLRNRDGVEVWVVIAKGTFALHPDGTVERSKEQEPVRYAAEYSGNPGRSSLRYESDFASEKTATDIIFNGHVYAPAWSTVTHLTATLRVGPLRKTICATGDRRWEKVLLRLRLSDPEPFERIPLIWERAYGGVSADGLSFCEFNPVGTGYFVAKTQVDGTPAPNIEYPSSLIRHWKDRPLPAGFGAVSPAWMPRRRFAGTFDERWRKERDPLLPDDFDPRFYQWSPRDQQVQGFLQGGEILKLTHLTPEGELTFQLPCLDLELETLFRSGSSNRQRASISSVIVEPDLHRVVMVWQLILPCRYNAHQLVQTHIFEV